MQKMKYLEGLTKHYTFIDTPKPVRLVANPFKTSAGWSGTDSAFLPAGAWRIDNWTLLLDKDFPNSPAFKLALVWDDEQLDIDKVTIEFHDVNFGEGVAGVAGQAVIVNGFSGLGLTQLESIGGKIDTVGGKIDDSNSMLSRLVAELDSLDNGTILNKIEQIRTYLKGSQDSALTSIDFRLGLIFSALGRVVVLYNEDLRSFDSNFGYVNESLFRLTYRSGSTDMSLIFLPHELTILEHGSAFYFCGKENSGTIRTGTVPYFSDCYGTLRRFDV